MKNICYILSGINTALAFEWIYERLDNSKFKLHFILLHSQTGDFEKYLIDKKAGHVRINYSSKKDIPRAVVQTIKYLKNNSIEIIHSHLLDAGIVGSIAAKYVGIKTSIYTRHYSTYHHEYHPKGVWYDKLINKISSKIIAVSEVVKQVLVEKENVPESKIEIIHHGFPLAHFSEVTADEIGAMKSNYGISKKQPIIGVVSRHTKWKGIQYIIPAFEKILKEYPNAHLVLANAKGEFHASICLMLKELPQDSFTMVEFENNLFTLFKCFDVFVHVPINNHAEAFGQVYVEAMAAGIPSVLTLSGIGNEIAKNNINSVIAVYQDSESIEKGIRKILENPDFAAQISSEATKSVQKKFELDAMISKLTVLYE